MGFVVFHILLRISSYFVFTALRGKIKNNVVEKCERKQWLQHWKEVYVPPEMFTIHSHLLTVLSRYSLLWFWCCSQIDHLFFLCVFFMKLLYTNSSKEKLYHVECALATWIAWTVDDHDNNNSSKNNINSNNNLVKKTEKKRKIHKIIKQEQTMQQCKIATAQFTMVRSFLPVKCLCAPCCTKH